MFIPTPDKQNKLTNSYREERSQYEYLPRNVGGFKKISIEKIRLDRKINDIVLTNILSSS